MEISNKKRKYIKRSAGIKTPEELAGETGLSLNEVKTVLKELGLSAEVSSEPAAKPEQPSLFQEKTFIIFIAALLILVPLFFIPGLYDMYSLPKYGLLIAAFPAAALIFCGIILSRRQFSFIPCIRFPMLPLVLLCMLSVGSMIWAVNRYEAILSISRWIYTILFLFMTVQVIRSQKDIALLSTVITIAGMLVSILGIFQFFGHNIEFIYQAAVPGSTFGNKNFATQFIVGVIPFSIFAAYFYRTKKRSVLFSFSFFVLLFFIFISRTRGAWVATAFGLGTGFVIIPLLTGQDWLRNARRFFRFSFLNRYILPGLVFLLVLSALAIIPSQNSTAKRTVDVREELKSIAQTQRGSAHWRLTAWKNTLYMIKEHPFGIGIGHWQFYYPLFAQKAAVDKDFSEDRQAKRAHNDYLQTAAELGLPGLALLLWFFLNIIYCTLYLSRLKGLQSWNILGISVFSAVTAIMIDAVFNFPLQEGLPPFFLAIISAFAVYAVQSGKEKHTISTEPATKIVVMGAIVVFGFLFIYNTWWAYRFCKADYAFLEGKRFNKGDMFEQSLLPLRESIEYNPHNYRTYSILGRSLNELRKYEESVEVNNKALALHPYYINVMNNLGNALRGVKKVDSAIAIYNRALELFPKFAEAHNNLGIAYKQLGDVERAKKEYLRAIEIDPEYEKAFNNLGNICLAEGKTKEAIEYYEKAVAINPKLSDVYNNLGLAMINTGNNEKALEYLDKCIDLNTRLPDPYNNKGTALKNVGKLDESIVFFKQAIAVSYSYLPAYNNLAQVYTIQKKYVLAAEEYEKITQVDPSLRAFYQKSAEMFLMAYEDEKIPEYVDRAIEILQRGISLFPDFTNLHTVLGKAYLDSGQIDKSLELFQEVLRLAPDKPESYYNMGVACHQNKQYTEALENYKRALEMNPDFIFLHFEIGKIYETLGMYNEAIASIAKFIELWKGEPEYIQRAQNKITALQNKLENTK
ncbi:MAG: tetratricopeptide repeat protein [Candidatus Auribacter fodinae]|jgi:tetratricopeptide (TPR) repeat protein|uniref:Tetratricopeptide repeat protein n=1 Tax=Candidatus Auribacter fodinae TaxID=2093366 RepID=A0A3A4R9N4_9BACT|nr:MAG: tetratricopeptide repeat protein [Candidatus Auribacter fodinae]